MQIQALLEPYCRNDMRALKNISYRIFCKYGIDQKDHDDFYSIANMVLWQCSQSYDNSKNDNFEAFLCGCLQRKFKTELTRRNRQKRITDSVKVSLDAAHDEDNKESSLINTLASDFDTFEEVIKEQKTEQYQEKIQVYLSKLSKQQISILNLLIDGYSANDIKDMLNMSSKEYADNLQIMRAFEKVKVLF